MEKVHGEECPGYEVTAVNPVDYILQCCGNASIFHICRFKDLRKIFIGEQKIIYNLEMHLELSDQPFNQ